jgi:hypothetical protein
VTIYNAEKKEDTAKQKATLIAVHQHVNLLANRLIDGPKPDNTVIIRVH